MEAARYKTYGCPAVIGCFEAVCRWAEGRPADELRSLEPGCVAELAGGVPDEKSHCPPLAAGAARACRRVA